MADKLSDDRQYHATDSRRPSQYQMSIAEDNEDGGDTMDELSMANPGSIEHFQRIFYPEIPCRQCSYCWKNNL